MAIVALCKGGHVLQPGCRHCVQFRKMEVIELNVELLPPGQWPSEEQDDTPGATARISAPAFIDPSRYSRVMGLNPERMLLIPRPGSKRDVPYQGFVVRSA